MMKKIVVLIVASIILISSHEAQATMDGTIASLNRDESLLSTEFGSTSPCPLPPGEFSGIEQGRFSVSWLKSLCIYDEMDSFIHHLKVREYIRLLPPENVFAVWWEGRVSPSASGILGPALAGLRHRKGRTWKSGRFLYIVGKHGGFVVDTKLIPPGLDPKNLAPAP